jgi:hypothetical protein
MTSTFTTRKKSPFAQLKEQLLGNPEQALLQAYEVALRIKDIEEQYFGGNRIPIESLEENPSLPPYLIVDITKNLELLPRKAKEFNSNSASLNQLGSSHLEKILFVEGILAKYTCKMNSSLALMPLGMTTNLVNSEINSPVNSQPSLVKMKTIEVQPIKEKSPANSSNNTQVNGVSSVLDKTGVLPRSLGKTINKITKDIHPKGEQEVVDDFRRSRAMTIVGVRLISLLIIVPLLTQQLSKHLLIAPIVQQVRGNVEVTISLEELNSEWKEEALVELNQYEEQLKMEHMLKGVPALAPEVIEAKVEVKANEIAQEFHHKSNNAIANVFADLLGLIAFTLVLLFRRKDINILKSFLDNVIYGLSDSAKAFGIILFTDIFVGFHSPHGWEVLIEGLANHLGVAASHNSISLFIATVPVVMDTMFKYWIFRYLSRMSPSTVATLKEMNE